MNPISNVGGQTEHVAQSTRNPMIIDYGGAQCTNLQVVVRPQIAVTGNPVIFLIRGVVTQLSGERAKSSFGSNNVPLLRFIIPVVVVSELPPFRLEPIVREHLHWTNHPLFLLIDTERCHEKRESRYMCRMTRPAADNPHANFLDGATHAAMHRATPTETGQMQQLQVTTRALPVSSWHRRHNLERNVVSKIRDVGRSPASVSFPYRFQTKVRISMIST